MIKVKWYYVVGVIVLLALIIFFAGYKTYPKCNPCPQPQVDTLLVYDTIVHTIYDTLPWYSLVLDTVTYIDTLPPIVDTMAILKRYYAFFHYTQTWEDSLLWSEVEQIISENKIMAADFRYKILRPQQIIYPVDTIEVSIPRGGMYIYALAGGNMGNFLYGGGVDYITKKNMQFGVMYQRFGKENLVSLKAGTLIRFK